MMVVVMMRMMMMMVVMMKIMAVAMMTMMMTFVASGLFVISVHSHGQKYPRAHISPHTTSKPGRPACKHSNMVASKASPKASGPATALLAYLQLRWMLMTTRLLSPKRGF